MFKKFGKPVFDKEYEAPIYEDLADRPPTPFAADLMNALHSEADEAPEINLASGASIKGTIIFQKLARIDGHFEGEMVSEGKLVVGPTGSVKADVNLEEAFISGKVEGNITVKKRLVLRGRAEVRGSITAPLISVDEGVSIVGSLNIAQIAENPLSEEEIEYYSSDQ